MHALGEKCSGQAEADETVAEVLGVEAPGLLEAQVVVREEPLAVDETGGVQFRYGCGMTLFRYSPKVLREAIEARELTLSVLKEGRAALAEIGRELHGLGAAVDAHE